MSVTGQGPADEWYVVQQWGVGERWGPAMDDATDAPPGNGGAVWMAYPEEGMQRASVALADDGDVWLVDPVDTPDLDELVDVMGELRGVAVLLERHWRDAGEIADRHDALVFAPDFFSDVPELDAPVRRFADPLPDTDYRARRVVNRRFWQEAALFDGETLVVPEALGTASYYRLEDESLGIHPLLRLRPPVDALGDLGPERIVVGHGDGIAGDATPALEAAFDGVRRTAPRAIARMLYGWARS